MKAEETADAARRELGIGLHSAVPDLLRLVEDEAGLRVFIVPLTKDGIDGAYQLDRGEPFVLLNQSFHHVRKRFTLAHEFGHHRLGHGAQLDRKIDVGDRRQTEVEANVFAAALLLPRAAIDDWFARHEDPKLDLEVVVRLAVAFNVSSFVARYRLEAVNRLPSRAQKQKLDEALKAGRHLDLTKEVGLLRAKDTLAVAEDRGGYVPATMQVRIADLVQRGLLSREAAKSRLRIPNSKASELIDELLDPALVAE